MSPSDTTNGTAADEMVPLAYVSIVVPLFNEAENVRRLYEAIRDALAAVTWSFEMVFVDDGSSDQTLANLAELADADARVKVIPLRRNFGQTAAMRAGIDHSAGAVIITMDGDLQNDPRDIPTFVKKVEQGHDLVAGWRKDRKDGWLLRKLPSKIANRLIAKIIGVPIHDTGCSLKAFRAELIRNVPLYSELHRFIPHMSTLATGRFAEIVVRHHPRRYGTSKYGIGRIGRVLIDLLAVKMLLSSSRQPLRWYGAWSAPFLLTAMVLMGYSASQLFAASEPPTVVIPLVAFLLGQLGVHLLISGFLAELVVHSAPSQPIAPLTRIQRVPQSHVD